MSSYKNINKLVSTSPHVDSEKIASWAARPSNVSKRRRGKGGRRSKWMQHHVVFQVTRTQTYGVVSDGNKRHGLAPRDRVNKIGLLKIP